MRTKKALLAALCACLLVVGSVMGTMAYLTSSDSVTNTFTVGSVKLEGESGHGLDEAKTDVYGVKANPEVRVDANEYLLVPGHKYVKDPTVHVQKDSESCYVFVKVENGIAAIEAATNTVADQIAAKEWKQLKIEGTAVEGVYYKEWTKGSAVVDLVVFDEFTVAGSVDNDTLDTYKNAKIIVTAYAVQMDGLSVEAAWGAAQEAAAKDAGAQG